MSIALPDQIEPLLHDYLRLMDETVPGLLAAFYLHGSIALGAFNPRSSDIDFVAVLRHRCSATDIEGLETVHQKIAVQYPRWVLEGSYLQWQDMGKFDEGVLPYPHYADKVLDPMNGNSLNAVTWWILKNKGVAIVGPPLRELDFTVEWSRLLSDMAENLNTYWVSFTKNPKRMSWLLTDYGVQWAVLGVLRQWYTFQEHDITSKTGAGHYALAHLPSRWQRIIQEAIRIREGGENRGYTSRIRRSLDVLHFLKFIIHDCNTNILPAALAATSE